MSRCLESWRCVSSMSSDGLRDFRTEVEVLEDVTTRGSEQTLRDQEERLISAIREITQSITSMSHENNLVRLDGVDGNAGAITIDLSSLAERIAEFDKLIELLKMTHLEQETLDFFLRYTISSAELLQLKSTHDQQYVEMESAVKALEREIEEAHHRWIDETKLQISNAAEQIVKDQDTVNELYLETADILDDCDQLLVEVEKMREEKERYKKQVERQKPSVAKVFDEWDEVRRCQNDLKHLEAQIAQLELIKKDFEAKDTAKKLTQDPKLNELGCTLDSLIRLWESNFLPNPGWHDLEIYPQIKKIQFDVLEIFTVLIALDGGYRISDVTIYRKGEGGMSVDEDLQSELKQQNVGSRDVYKSMEAITGYLIGLAPVK
ncbi:hypothetical protein HG536_0B00350 [Torulaspora globosa]|uniref:Spindle pole body component KRE28 n=1 Tax=Torulaspora globosa TaxID=48254 RepID=A0A7G3ZCD8_9SACH|nr:uncharacterized protein HG536_0B00350 [Torulaspora globosa]QLL31174.1 hypothetical protein HG536_0B00350 [Torulaspora globosa]